MEPNTSAGSVATRARCSGILNNHFTNMSELTNKPQANQLVTHAVHKSQ